MNVSELPENLNDSPVIIYVDGACSGNPGPGGWGAVVNINGKEKELSGFESRTTNNRMELVAAIEGIKAATKGATIDIHTDSQYVKNGITLWIHNWKKKSWMTADNKPVKNQDLWTELDAQLSQYTIRWHWVKGHAGHPINERADALARRAIIAARMGM